MLKDRSLTGIEDQRMKSNVKARRSREVQNLIDIQDSPEKVLTEANAELGKDVRVADRTRQRKGDKQLPAGIA